jgi:hypothetical protein
MVDVGEGTGGMKKKFAPWCCRILWGQGLEKQLTFNEKYRGFQEFSGDSGALST